MQFMPTKRCCRLPTGTYKLKEKTLDQVKRLRGKLVFIYFYLRLNIEGILIFIIFNNSLI